MFDCIVITMIIQFIQELEKMLGPRDKFIDQRKQKNKNKPWPLSSTMHKS